MSNTCTFDYKGSYLQHKKRKISDVATKPTIFEQTPVEPKKKYFKSTSLDLQRTTLAMKVAYRKNKMCNMATKHTKF